MYAADAFGDNDTKRCAREYYPLDPLQLHAELKNLKEEIDKVDGLIIGSGFESADFGVLKEEDRSKKGIHAYQLFIQTDRHCRSFCRNCRYRSVFPLYIFLIQELR